MGELLLGADGSCSSGTLHVECSLSDHLRLQQTAWMCLKRFVSCICQSHSVMCKIISSCCLQLGHSYLIVLIINGICICIFNIGLE